VENAATVAPTVHASTRRFNELGPTPRKRSNRLTTSSAATLHGRPFGCRQCSRVTRRCHFDTPLDDRNWPSISYDFLRWLLISRDFYPCLAAFLGSAFILLSIVSCPYRRLFAITLDKYRPKVLLGFSPPVLSSFSRRTIGVFSGSALFSNPRTASTSRSATFVTKTGPSTQVHRRKARNR